MNLLYGTGVCAERAGSIVLRRELEVSRYMRGDFAEQIGIDWKRSVDIFPEKEAANSNPELADACENVPGIPNHVWRNRQRQ